MNSFLTLLSSSITSTASPSTSMLMAGAAENIITPTTELDVYEDLYARALVLADYSEFREQGNDVRHLVIISLDQFGCAYYEVVLRAISKATGIPPNHIFLNYSHSHNALGPVGEWTEEKQASTAEIDIPYEEWLGDDFGRLGPWDTWLVGHIIEAAKRAFLALQPATLHVGRAPARIGYNRRELGNDGRIRQGVNLEGAVVPWVDVLGVYGEDGGRIAAMFSHAAHPVIVHYDWKNGIQTLQKIVGENTMFLFRPFKGLLVTSARRECHVSLGAVEFGVEVIRQYISNAFARTRHPSTMAAIQQRDNLVGLQPIDSLDKLPIINGDRRHIECVCISWEKVFSIIVDGAMSTEED